MRNKKDSQKGFALLSALAFTLIFITLSLGILTYVNAEVNISKRQIDSIKAFFLAESGIERAIRSIKSGAAAPATFTLSQTGALDSSTGLDDVVINISSDYNSGTGLYEVRTNSTVNRSKRTIRANINHYPPSKVFNYAYFLNNWGWFYGNSITANGDIRSNGRFDFGGYKPTVEGEVYAAKEIGGGQNIKGKAGTLLDGEYIYQHPNSPRVDMPNLQNLSYYEGLAVAKGSSVSIGGTTLVSAVLGDEAGESGNIVLIGTKKDPIVINGPVVVRGDVVIKGYITGQGAIYAGRNLYVAADIEYSNGLDSPRPDSGSQDDINEWVNENKDKDIVGFAATENIILGDYTGSSGGAWYADGWIFSMGSEDVGQDGIPDTHDTGEGDGEFQSNYEDLDGDGVFDDNYTWTDIQTQTDIKNFANVPKGTQSFGQIATNNVHNINGLYYTNHAFAGRLNTGQINGSVISKDEVIVYSSSITMNYDERAHSRYASDPNWIIDLRLPVSNKIEIAGWWEE